MVDISKILKLIFLDIDGVLNHEVFYKLEGHMNQDVEYPASNMCPNAIKKLNKIIRRTGAKVVISSTWRLGRSIEELQEILELRGFEGEVISKTESIGFKIDWACRGNEIEKWLIDNEKLLGVQHKFDYFNYVILDDDTDMLYDQTNQFIPIDAKVGIVNSTVNKAISILNKEYKPKYDWSN